VSSAAAWQERRHPSLHSHAHTFKQMADTTNQPANTQVNNDTFLPTLIKRASIDTPAPLLLFLTRNVTLAPHPALPPGGLNVRRPLYVLGARVPVPTGIDFGGRVNIIKLSGHGRITFDNLYLENLVRLLGSVCRFLGGCSDVHAVIFLNHAVSAPSPV